MLDSPNELVIDDTVTFKSARDGSTIAFTISSRNEDETQFIVSVKTPSSSGSAVASTYHSGPPSVLFEEIAEN